MQFVDNDPKLVYREEWEEFWPTTLIALIATGQMLLTFIVIAFETWSRVHNARYSFLSIGYDTAFFFSITWISTFIVVCCNRGSQGCATHALVENILSVIASVVLISFDARFLQDPSTCFRPGNICYDLTNWNIWWNIYDDDIHNANLIAIKVQLSCAVIMLALCLLFIVIYIYTIVKVRAKSASIYPQATIELRPQEPLVSPPPIPVWSEQPPAWPPSSNF